MTRPGAPWGDPAGGDPVVDVAGDDADLAAAAAAAPGSVLRFSPTPASDLARALGLAGASSGTTIVACDLLDMGLDMGAEGSAVNAIVFGVAPDRLRWHHRRHRVTVDVDGRRLSADRATTVVVASGQFVRGADVVPRGHPGDGRIEVQVYCLDPGERAAMRVRLPGGDHVPHPRVTQASGREVTIRWGRGVRPVEVDGRARAPRGTATVRVVPGAVRVLI